MIEACYRIKNDLVKYSKDRPIDETGEPQVLELVNNINEFSHSFKKRKARKVEKAVPVEEPASKKAHYNPFNVEVSEDGNIRNKQEAEPKRF